jgi:hypothetical protein
MQSLQRASVYYTPFRGPFGYLLAESGYFGLLWDVQRGPCCFSFPKMYGRLSDRDLPHTCSGINGQCSVGGGMVISLFQFSLNDEVRISLYQFAKSGGAKNSTISVFLMAGFSILQIQISLGVGSLES